VGLARPPPAAPPVASVQAGTGGGRPGPAAGRSGQAAPQATADQRPLACASRKRQLPAKKKDEQVCIMHLTSEVLLGAFTVRMSFLACRGLVFFNLVVLTLASM